MKAAVLGAGRMGRRHMQVVRDLGLELIAIADISPDVLGAAGAEHGVPEDRRFTDVAALLNAGVPDCVIVSTTAPSHAEYVCAAAEAGAKYVLCEKPLATSLAECDRMIECCRIHGVNLAANHQMRFMEQYTAVKELLQSQELGGLTSVTVVAGNFGIAMNGTHYFEMFRYLTDEPPVEVTAWFSPDRVPNPRGPQYEDRAGSVRLRTASGRRFYMDVGADQGHGMTVTYGARFGQIWVDELAGDLRVSARDAEHRSLPTTRYGLPAHTTSRQITPADAFAPTRAVLRSLLAGGDIPTGQDGRLAVSALVAAYVSAEQGSRPVQIDSTNLPRERVFPWA